MTKFSYWEKLNISSIVHSSMLSIKLILNDHNIISVIYKSILEDNKSRVSSRIQAKLHRPLLCRHSNAKDTTLVIG